MKKFLFMIITLAFGVSGCNTLNGIGKDVEKLGEKVQDASKK
ncbi:COG5510 Predicted small secreted protein [Oxalobacteraceae bacterium]